MRRCIRTDYPASEKAFTRATRAVVRRWLTYTACVLSCGASGKLAGQTGRTLGDPLPLELSVSLRAHNQRSPINLSPDGAWVAHTIETNETVPRNPLSRRYSATGFPFAEGDARMEATLSSTSTGEVVRLGSATSASWAPVWSPDGQRVAFYSDEGGSAGLWIWERSSRAARRVPGLIARPMYGFETVHWLSDGHRLLLKVLPEGMTVEQANAAGSSSPVPAGPRPESPRREASVVVQRFDPTEAAPARAGTVAARPEPARQRWAEADLALVDLRSGSATRLVRETAVRAYAVSPDERHVAYTVYKGGEPNSQQTVFDLVVQEIAGGNRRTLAANTRLAYGIEWSWSPDSRTLAQISSGPLGGGGIVLYGIADGSVRPLGRASLPSFDPGDGEYPPLWDARGDNIYAVGDSSLWKIDVASGAGTRVGQVPGWRIRSAIWRHGDPTIWSHDRGRTVWVTARKRDGTASGIYSVDVASGRTRLALEEPKSYGAAFNVAASGGRREIAFVSAGQREPTEIWTMDTRSRRARRVSRINAALDRYPLGAARTIEWRSAAGQPLRGALLLPPNYRPGTRLPLVVYVYGGQMGSRAVNTFGLLGTEPVFNMHVLSTRGYAVLYPDAPLREGMPVADLVATVMPGVDAAIEQGYADPGRLAVMGQSYGSYSTLALVTQTTRFKAAVITGAVLHPDLFADYLRNIGYYEGGQGNMGGSIWEHHDRYASNSPLFRFDRIATPLLIGQGERDGDLVPSNAIFTALKRLGKPVEYRLYGGEGHVITQRPNVIDFWNRRLDFLAEHLDLAVDPRGAVVFDGDRAKSRAAAPPR